MTSPDSPSPRTEAGRRFHANEHGAICSFAASGNCALVNDGPWGKAWIAQIEAEAAQEAPAPDGLLHSRAHDAVGAWTHYFDAHERAPFWKALCEAMDALAVETRKPAAPSPAEPPRPFRDHETCVPHDHVEPDTERWERDQAAAFRAEARPPEGLAEDRLRDGIAAALDTEAVANFMGGPFESGEITVLSRYLAARLSARGAEPR